MDAASVVLVVARTASRRPALFLALITVQAAHSIEEYVTRLYEVFAPARFISTALGTDARFGFAVSNAALVALGAWCYFRRVRPEHPGAVRWMWFWAVLELGNGVGHLGLAAQAGGYFPGAGTAPMLILLAGLLLYRLLQSRAA